MVARNGLRIYSSDSIVLFQKDRTALNGKSSDLGTVLFECYPLNPYWMALVKIDIAECGCTAAKQQNR
jgi:hypothetical protein